MSVAQAQLDLAGLRARRREIVSRAAEHGAHNVRVFGSTARGEAEESSDVDLLVEMEPGRNLLDLVGLWQHRQAYLLHALEAVDAIRRYTVAAPMRPTRASWAERLISVVSRREAA